ncbi:AMP-binding protein, partial [Alteromonas sp. 5E99-2]|uniref:condensation domain-containing protein n=1 Tax=Alteromonas sp. 5E99-2 TaxID=2817683 RepID=UPI001A99E6C6
ILALQVVARARKQGMKFSPKALMNKQTIAELISSMNAPKGEIEETLAAIWCDILKLERVSRHDNFFELGGDSILALQVVARARKQGLKCKPKQLLEAQHLADLAKCMVSNDAAVSEFTAQDSIANKGIQSLSSSQRSSIPLSFAQARQWFLWQLMPDSTAYHIPGALKFTGSLDVSALTTSFNEIVQRHESFRTNFTALDDGHAQQVIHPEGQLTLSEVDLSALNGEEQQAQARAQALAWNSQAFDLTQDGLLRVGVIKLSADEHILVVVMHHIISDGWSMQLLINEFVARYEALITGGSLTLPPLSIHYADYAVWQRNWLAAGELEKQLAYWCEHLDTEQGEQQPVLQLATDNARGLDVNYTQANYVFTLPAALSRSLKQVSGANQSTLFMSLLAAYQVLLYRYTGQEDIRIGVPIANRHRSEVEQVIGFFVNTQVLRGVLDSSMSLSEVLAQAKATALGAQAHQDLPFEKLVEALQPERSLQHTPLFQVMYNHQRKDTQALSQLSDLTIEEYALGDKAAQFELILNTTENAEGDISIDFSYAKELFNHGTIKRLGEHYTAILTALTQEPKQRIGDIALLSKAETEALLAIGSNEISYEQDTLVHELIEQQARSTPNGIALVFEDETLTYQVLNARANQLAHYLIAQGVQPEDTVGIAVERSVEMVVGLLAILKVGGAYVPLDPNYPQERLAYIMSDSGISTLLT